MAAAVPLIWELWVAKLRLPLSQGRPCPSRRTGIIVSTQVPRNPESLYLLTNVLTLDWGTKVQGWAEGPIHNVGKTPAYFWRGYLKLQTIFGCPLCTCKAHLGSKCTDQLGHSKAARTSCVLRWTQIALEEPRKNAIMLKTGQRLANDDTPLGSGQKEDSWLVIFAYKINR